MSFKIIFFQNYDADVPRLGRDLSVRPGDMVILGSVARVAISEVGDDTVLAWDSHLRLQTVARRLCSEAVSLKC